MSECCKTCCNENNNLNLQNLIEIIISIIIYLCAIFAKEPEIKIILYILSYIAAGHDVLLSAIKNIRYGLIFDENFLMSAATIGAIGIGEYPEAVMVMLLYKIGESLQERAVNKSKNSISKLINIRPEYAYIEKEGELIKVLPEEVKVGEIIIVKSGEKIPLDGIVIEGNSYVDTSAITGESKPKSVTVDDEIYSGCINSNGVIKIKVTKEYKNSTVSKIIELVESSGEKKAKSEKYITKFAKIYTPIVVFSAVLLTIIPVLGFHQSFNVWFERALTFLVISCPCAFVLSIPLTFFAGIGAASASGILIKGGNYIEQLSRPYAILFDKTGTITNGNFRISQAICEGEISVIDLLGYAAKAEHYSSHPIAQVIKNTYHGYIDPDKIINIEETIGKGIKAEVEGENIFVGSRSFLESKGFSVPQSNAAGTIIYIAKENQYLGLLVITDTIKKEAYKTIEELRNKKIRTVMLTGDTELIGKTVAGMLFVDEYHTKLLPEDKVSILEEKIETANNRSVIFVGDGINDAPVLKRADVGIAMGALGTDAAIEAADVVIMDDNIEKITELIQISKRTMKIVNENIAFAIGIKFLFLIAGALGYVTLWGAVFADVGVTLIAVLNSLRALQRQTFIQE